MPVEQRGQVTDVGSGPTGNRKSPISRRKAAVFPRWHEPDDARVWEPADCPTGVRHEGGVTLRRASIRNTGTCRSDVKGEIQAAVAARIRVPMRSTGAEMPVVGKKVL